MGFRKRSIFRRSINKGFFKGVPKNSSFLNLAKLRFKVVPHFYQLFGKPDVSRAPIFWPFGGTPRFFKSSFFLAGCAERFTRLWFLGRHPLAPFGHRVPPIRGGFPSSLCAQEF